MDLMKIGKFISELRKENNLTQEELGEKLGVTNKTISRYETGTYTPPADILLKISELFNVSINEILTGKRLSDEEYKKAAEENLKQTIKDTTFTTQEKVIFYKQKWIKDNMPTYIIIYSILIILFILGTYFHKHLLVSIILVLLLYTHIYRNNKMMAYVENKAYDGFGNIDEIRSYNNERK